MEKDKKQKAKGIIVFAPKESQKSFLLCELVITPRDLFDYLKNEGKQYLSDYNDKKTGEIKKQLKIQITYKGDEVFHSINEYGLNKNETKSKNDLPF